MFDQAIWFGNQMKKFLIDPNQCWEFGVMIYDGPTNKYRYIGIEAYEIFVPWHMKNTTCDTMTLSPADEDL